MNGPIKCEICHEDLGYLKLEVMQLHYEQHFRQTDSPPVASSSKQPSSTSFAGGPKKKFMPRKFNPKPKRFFQENDVFWYPSKADPPPKNFTPGLIPLLRKSLLASHARGELRKAALCYSDAVYIEHELWDAGWGCGYRNFLMACACLMAHPLQPMYFPLLDDPISPSIRNLQVWIEDAWKRGFDPEGREQLKKLIGTRKWIGTSDLYIAFSSRSIPAELADFADVRDPQIVTNWIVNYFTPAEPIQRNAFEQLKGASPVICTHKPPIILQHDGHSRSIVGYEIVKDGTTNLLTFDSGGLLSKDIRTLALSVYKSSTPTPILGGALKRSAPDTPNTSSKRRRQHSRSPGVQVVQGHAVTDDDEVVITGSSPASKSGSSRVGLLSSKPIDHPAILKHFRLRPRKLGTKKQYQILYFPMTDPLSESEMQKRKNVKSTRIC